VENAHNDLAVQALVWLRTVRFRVIRFSTSYVIVRQPNIFEHQF